MIFVQNLNTGREQKTDVTNKREIVNTKILLLIKIIVVFGKTTKQLFIEEKQFYVSKNSTIYKPLTILERKCVSVCMFI